MPQQTGTNPFNLQQQAQQGFNPQQGQQPFGQPQVQQPFGQQSAQQPFGGFLQPQQTGFLVPQSTGANPFRQSMLLPQSTGFPGATSASPFGVPPQQQPQAPAQVPFQTGSTNPFPQGNSFGVQQQSTNPFPGGGQPQTSNSNPFPGAGQPQNSNPFPNFASGLSLGSQPTGFASSSNPFPSSFGSNNQPSVASPLAQPASSGPTPNAPARSMSVPLGGPPNPEPVKTHQTGSRNPFGQPVAPAPPVPKVPTLMELAMNKAQGNYQPQSNGSTSPTSLQPQATGFNPGQSNSLISNVASSFSLGNENQSSSSSNANSSTPSFLSNPLSLSPNATGSTFSNSVFSSLSSQPTGATSTGSAPLQPQTTGFSGLKAFKPSSSFGAALLESLPPIPQSAPTTPNLEQTSKHTPTGSLGSSGLLGSQPTGFGADTKSSVGVGLRPQATGLAGGANPFRATMFSLSPSPATGGAFSGGLTSNPTGNAFGGLGGGLAPQSTGFPSQFGAGNQNLFGGAGGPFGAGAGTSSNNQQQQQQNGQASLI